MNNLVYKGLKLFECPLASRIVSHKVLTKGSLVSLLAGLTLAVNGLEKVLLRASYIVRVLWLELRPYLSIWRTGTPCGTAGTGATLAARQSGAPRGYARPGERT